VIDMFIKEKYAAMAAAAVIFCAQGLPLQAVAQNRGAYTPISDAKPGVSSDIVEPTSSGQLTAEPSAGMDTQEFTPLPRQGGATTDGGLINQASLHYEAGVGYLSKWQLDLAECELRSSIMCVPDTQAAHRELMLVSLARFDFYHAAAEAFILSNLGKQMPYDQKQTDDQKLAAFKLHYERGIKLASQKKYKEAYPEYEWALFYQPDNGRVLRSLAFAQASDGDFAAAEANYSRSFAADPADPYGHADMAFLLADRGMQDSAIAQLEQAVKLEPDVTALRVDLGWLMESQGQIARAESEFDEAVRLSPKQASLWMHLGKLRVKTGKQAEAATALKQALALDPSLQEAKQALQGIH